MLTSAIRRHPTLVRRIGAAGFFLFLLKGLLWVTAPLVFLWLGAAPL